MKLYFAPLEGITTSVYRNVHNEIFGGCDAYYAPFVSPGTNEKIVRKNLRELLAERNSAPVKAQILTNNCDGFINFAKKIKEIGYDEVNINFGCPSGTVVSKGKGVGMLKEKNGLDKFLNGIFSEQTINISVKTRIGFSSPEEASELVEIFNKYPISLLVIHPRTGTQYYSGNVDMDVFKKMYEKSAVPLCYNGDVLNAHDYNKIVSEFSNLDGVMIGRGAVQRPALFREISGGEKANGEELVLFTHRLLDEYNRRLESDTFTLHKLKEVWTYMSKSLPEDKKTDKMLKKAVKLSEFMRAVEIKAGNE